jgi:hypothetical protein
VLIIVIGLLVYQKINKGDGNIYFLRNNSGKDDLVKVNINKPDSRTVVLPGTG